LKSRTPRRPEGLGEFGLLLIALAVFTTACSGATATESGGAQQGSGAVAPEYNELRAVSTDETFTACPPPPAERIITPWDASSAIGATRVWVDVPLNLLIDALESGAQDEVSDVVSYRAGARAASGITDLRAAASIISLRRASELYDEWLFSPGLQELLRDEKADTVLVGLGSGAQGPEVGAIRNVYIETGNGGFTVVGKCGTTSVIAAGVARYAEAVGASSSFELLRSLATSQEALDAFEAWQQGAPVVWAAAPATQRLLDVEETPVEVLDRLGVITVNIDNAPDEWRTFEAVICTWVSQGWNECTAFDAGESGEPLELLAYVVPGEPIEVWVLNAEANLSEPLGRLGTFDIDTASQRLDLSVTSSRTTLAELLSDVASGVAVLEVAD